MERGSSAECSTCSDVDDDEFDLDSEDERAWMDFASRVAPVACVRGGYREAVQIATAQSLLSLGYRYQNESKRFEASFKNVLDLKGKLTGRQYLDLGVRSQPTISRMDESRKDDVEEFNLVGLPVGTFVWRAVSVTDLPFQVGSLPSRV